MFLLADGGFQVIRQGIELVFPEGAILRDPRRGVLHGLGGEAAAVHAAVDFAVEEACGLEDAQVLRDGRQRNAERFGELGNHGLAPSEAGQDGAAGGIRKRTEGGIQKRVGIVNHSV